MALSKEEELFLSDLSKNVINRYLREGSFVETPAQVPSSLLQKRGIFLSIKKSEAVSGKAKTLCCLGYLFPKRNLVESLLTLATNGAIRIRSLEKVCAENLNDLHLEINILEQPERLEGKPLEYSKKIDIKRDGIMIKDGPKVGVIIPSEMGDPQLTSVEYIGECCAKVGLTADAWITGKIEVYRFRVHNLKVVLTDFIP